MLTRPKPHANARSPQRADDDYEWRQRCCNWMQYAAPTNLVSSRRRAAQPLVLCGHGVSLSVEKGTLLVRDGLTHYPQERREVRIFPGEPTRPTRILVLDAPGLITFDAIDWLRDQDIALVRIDWKGNTTIICGGLYAAGGEAWRRQVALSADAKSRMTIAKRLIREKLENSVATLEGCIPSSQTRDFAVGVIRERQAALTSRMTLNLSHLHGIEGRAAKVYFDAWIGVPLHWCTSKRHPIPGAWRAIGQRQSLNTGKKGKNYDASHPLNAMLNYAYAVLESQIRLDVLAHGYDPRRGFLHMGGREQPALVLDLMEPLRPVVDAAILQFALTQTFAGADFVLRSDGVVRLNPQLARTIAGVAARAANSESTHFL